MNKVFAVDWYDESETGEIVASGTVVLAGSIEYRKAQWDKLVAEHSACFLRASNTEELYSHKRTWRQ